MTRVDPRGGRLEPRRLSGTQVKRVPSEYLVVDCHRKACDCRSAESLISRVTNKVASATRLRGQDNKTVELTQLHGTIPTRSETQSHSAVKRMAIGNGCGEHSPTDSDQTAWGRRA